MEPKVNCSSRFILHSCQVVFHCNNRRANVRGHGTDQRQTACQRLEPARRIRTANSYENGEAGGWAMKIRESRDLIHS
jgi:hypothetical protein